MYDMAARLEKIMASLKENNMKTIKQFADELGVSEMTIRRDISTLEKSGQVNVFFGGVSLNTSNATESDRSNQSGYSFSKEIGEKTDEKMRIALKAASLVEPKDVLFMDTGSTTGYIVPHLPTESTYIIYTYSLSILNSACDRNNIRVVGCGGYFHRDTRMFESDEGIQLLKKTQINKAFMGARGVTDVVGVTTAEPYEIGMKKAALAASQQKILLVDSSKFGKAWYAKYADLDEIDVIITDGGIKQEYREMLEKKDNITLYIV